MQQCSDCALIFCNLISVLFRCIPTLVDNLLTPNGSVIVDAAGNNVTKAVVEAGLK